MKLFFLSSLLAICTSACAMGVNIPQPDGSKPVNIIFHADPEFTQLERTAIQGGADAWAEATGGLAQISIYWDKDKSNTICKVAACLYRHHTDDPEVVKEDSEVCGFMESCVLGWVNVRARQKLALPTENQELHLVVDRDGSDLPKIATHELGHVLGLAHIPDPWAIMFPYSNNQQRGCITQSDLSEYCRVNSCGTHKLQPCDEK